MQPTGGGDDTGLIMAHTIAGLPSKGGKPAWPIEVWRTGLADSSPPLPQWEEAESRWRRRTRRISSPRETHP